MSDDDDRPNEDDALEEEILQTLDAATPAEPGYWIARWSPLADDEIGRVWDIELSAERVPEVTLDRVMRWLANRLGVTLRAVRGQFNARLRDIAPDEPATHGEWARWYLGTLGPHFWAEGLIWVLDEERVIWEPLPMNAVRDTLSQEEGKNCTRDSDYRAIASLAYNAAEVQTRRDGIEFPPGVAIGDQFYQLTRMGVRKAKLKPEHYARFAFDVQPKWRNGKFKKFIERIADEEQRQLLSQHFAAVLFGLMARMQKCALWYGPPATGKSTLQNILEAMVPEELISAVPPQDWDKEYHTAAMAGKVLNVVGEIEDRNALGAAFKNVTGGGRISARHPTQQPFSYISRAAQVFCSNYLPPSSDKSDAFWRRWSVVEFTKIVPKEKRKIHLAQAIKAEELDVVLAFALEGAELIGKASKADYYRFLETERQANIEAQWELEINTVAAFLHDDEYCILGDKYVTGKTLFYAEYKRWCQDNNTYALGRNKFNREMADSGSKLGVELVFNDNKTRVWHGVGLVDRREREVF